ncbi:MAG: AraC family transcriptional regulator [Fermentimonas sp.]|jgi:AraC-like DNA-binding protein|nr:AraC family transcriptional regulator [Fermentimonas sp.]HBT84874.1 AraC family transcriptional regulator [Porphyromonadaceae bacterium]MDD2931356.1 AraC family transcriptional regulator [Fermentimonas sp.]MDD3189819.1 AraC family transcriptional regulator [Fermentimonas sp.]MDD4284914.1 AraC family transcriptional regulator [Fermentimonas sp.]
MRYNDFGIDFKYLLVSEKDKKFGLTVNTVGFQPITQNAKYPSTEHPKSYYFNPGKGRTLSEYQIVYISKGRGTFKSDSTKKTDIVKGQAIILFPGQWHTYKPLKETGWNEYYIGFEGDIIDKIVENGFITPSNQVLDVGVNEDLVNLFYTAIRVAKEDKTAAQQNLAGITFNILGFILSMAQNKNFETKETAQIIERAKVIMLENINREIDTKGIAANLGISYSLFRKTFKEYTGYAPAQYFQELKLRRAKELLAETNYSVKEISYELDFNSYEYFLSFFKKKVGITPIEYRNSRRV